MECKFGEIRMRDEEMFKNETLSRYMQDKILQKLRQERWNDRKFELFVVKDSIWEEASKKPLHRLATQKEIEENIGRKLTHLDYQNLPLNYKENEAYVFNHLGEEEYNKMIELWRD